MVIWCIFILMCLFVLLLVLAYIKFALLTRRINKNWQALDSLLRYRTQFISALSLYGASLQEEAHAYLTQLNTAHENLKTARSVAQRAAEEAQISDAFNKILAKLSQQTELKQDNAFTKLQENIQHAETKIQRAQKRYNNSAQEFNMISSIIPLNLITAMFEMAPFECFEISAEDEKK